MTVEIETRRFETPDDRIDMQDAGLDSSLADHLYFAGVAFGTLGYTHLVAHGAIRLLVMIISLSGFMLITSSATFIYTIWGKNFRD